MKRVLIAFVVAVGGGWMIATDTGASSQHARLRAFVCMRALDPSNRLISVTAVMRPRPGTSRMELRFELLARVRGNGAVVEVSGGDLGDWVRPRNATLGSRPGDVWIFKHPVRDLAGPARYRFRVSFRWRAAHRRRLGTSVRVSPTCYEPERRPDLLVQSIEVKPISGQPASEQYIATIRNGGASAAGPFQVWFSDGPIVLKRSVAGMASHGTLTETFVGPACTPGAAPVVAVDPEHRIDDYNRANNSLQASCPA